jgi:hypothetical protein
MAAHRVTPGWLTLDDLRKLDEREHLMATQPKPKPKPEPEPEPSSSPVIEEPPETDTNASGNSLTDRMDTLFASQVALIERVDKLEERINAPPVGIGRRP